MGNLELASKPLAFIPFAVERDASAGMMTRGEEERSADASSSCSTIFGSKWADPGGGGAPEPTVGAIVEVASSEGREADWEVGERELVDAVPVVPVVVLFEERLDFDFFFLGG